MGQLEGLGGRGESSRLFALPFQSAHLLPTQIPITLSQETAMEVVVQIFQRLGLRSVLFTRQGALTGIITKMVRFTFPSALCTFTDPRRLHQDLHAHIHPKPETVPRRLRPGTRAPAPTSAALRQREGRRLSALHNLPGGRRPSQLEYGVGDDIGLLDDASTGSSRQGAWV